MIRPLQACLLAAAMATILCLGTALGGPDDTETTNLTDQSVAALPAQHLAMQVTR